MSRESDIPLFVTEETIKLAHHWITLFVTPSEFPILQVYFLELTSVVGVAEACRVGPVPVSSILVLARYI